MNEQGKRKDEKDADGTWEKKNKTKQGKRENKKHTFQNEEAATSSSSITKKGITKRE